MLAARLVAHLSLQGLFVVADFYRELGHLFSVPLGS